MDRYFKKRYIAAGIIFSFLYWLLESFIHLLFFWNGTLSEWLAPRNYDELWMRLLAVGIIMSFSIYISLLMKREERLKDRLSSSEARFEEFVNELPQTVFEMNLEGRFTYANNSAFETFGYTTEDFESGLYGLDMIAPQDRDRAATDIERTFAGEEVEDTECMVIRKDGTTFPASILTKRILKNGEVVGMRGITFDISPLKEKEETLRKMSQAVEHSPVSVVITNPQGKIEYVNPEFVRITGYSVEEAAGKNPRILNSGMTPPERFREMWKTISAGQVWRGTLINRKKNGDTYWEDVRISPMRDNSGEVSHYVGVKEDITERHMLEEKVRSSEKMLRSILDNMQDTYYRTDNEGKILKVSPSARELMGYEPDELIGSQISGYYLYPELRRHFIDTLKKGGGAVTNYQAEIRRKNGSIIWVSTNAKYYKNDEGEPLGVEGTIRNVTAQKEAENELADYAAQLEASNRLKELYIDIMGHDILNPVNVIHNASDLVYPALSESSHQEFCTMIKESAEEIEELISLAKKYSKVSNMKEINFAPTNLNNLLSAAVKRFDLSLKKKNMDIDLHLGEAKPVPANELLNDVVSNLISNAIKYGPEGGILEAGTEEGDKHIILFFRDRGEGIPDEHKESIFNRFERLERGAIKGTGLGLAICKGIMELHSGSIWVEDNPGGGSIFKASLPKI